MDKASTKVDSESPCFLSYGETGITKYGRKEGGGLWSEEYEEETDISDELEAPLYEPSDDQDAAAADKAKGEAMPDDQKYFEKYFDSRLSNIERVVQDQSTRIQENLKQHKEILQGSIASLKEKVDDAVAASAAITKEVSDNNRWWNKVLIGSVLSIGGLFVAVVALFAGMLYFMSNVSNSVNKDTTELRKELVETRKDFERSQHAIKTEILTEIQKAGKKNP